MLVTGSPLEAWLSKMFSQAWSSNSEKVVNVDVDVLLETIQDNLDTVTFKLWTTHSLLTSRTLIHSRISYLKNSQVNSIEVCPNLLHLKQLMSLKRSPKVKPQLNKMTKLKLPKLVKNKNSLKHQTPNLSATRPSTEALPIWFQAMFQEFLPTNSLISCLMCFQDA